MIASLKLFRPKQPHIQRKILYTRSKFLMEDGIYFSDGEKMTDEWTIEPRLLFTPIDEARTKYLDYANPSSTKLHTKASLNQTILDGLSTTTTEALSHSRTPSIDCFDTPTC